MSWHWCRILPYFVFFQCVDTHFCLIPGRNKCRQLNMTLNDLRRPRVFEVFCGKTSKIIFIVFSITFSPCVFWSQHDAPLLLSPFNRWLKHMEGKSVLALARSNITMRKFLHVWDEVFHRTIFRRPQAALFFLVLFYPSFIQWLQEYMSDMYPISTPKICRALCMWRFERHRTTAETQRQEYYCCLSRKKAD